ncbi:MAG: hypothetical protein KME29_08745 [Calothrix sp. FI2-JRJ7]|jgi:hypothetical protein|nr:hypothetical protein [Calothrix sp. FI2-JRJ7]
MAQLRWYLGYKYRNSSDELIKNISEKIHQHNLSKYIPVLRIEKRIKARGEFYFFIAVESSQKGVIPKEVYESNFLKLKYFKIPAVYEGASFTYEDIKPMVGASHDVCDYTNPIPYKPLPKIINEHWFDFTESQITNYLSQLSDASSKYKQLLYWLSALGYGTWESFKKTCDKLEIQEPTRVLRRLKLLGHIEFSLDGKRWSIAPTAIVQIPSNSSLQEFILCGQQSVDLLNKLQQYTLVNFINQPFEDAPPCIHIQVDSFNNISTLYNNVGTNLSITNAAQVSKQLASILPNINIWKNNLVKLPSIVTSCYNWQKFNGNNFVDCDLPTESGMYQMYSQDTSVHTPLRTLFYDKESNCWLCGDWYGLRFLALQQIQKACIFIYNQQTKHLVVPVSQRFPEIYERALVLASGILPTYKDSYLLYTKIEPDLANLLSSKLNLTCSGESTYA